MNGQHKNLWKFSRFYIPLTLKRRSGNGEGDGGVGGGGGGGECSSASYYYIYKWVTKFLAV